MHVSLNNIMAKMNKTAASRIQSHSAKTGTNSGFARRAQSTADKEE